MQDRKDLLKTIISFEAPADLPGLKASLAEYEWDSEELVQLTKQDIISILNRFLSSELSAKQVEDWADAIDMRDDVAFGDSGDEDTIYIVSELANPVSPLTRGFAEELLEELQTN